MTVDLYVYNATQQQIDTTSLMDDLVFRRGVLVPPGGQGHVQLPDQATATQYIAAQQKTGTVDHATVTNTSTFAGVSIATAPVTAKGVLAPISPQVHVVPAPKPKGK